MTKLRRQLPLILSVLTIPLALAACGGGGATPKLALHSCTVGSSQAQCGLLRVPENPSEPAGRKIALKVAVVRATAAHPKPDPLFWFAGWGSAGVSDDAKNVLSAFSQLNVDRDIVFIDQRGTGSTGALCQLAEDAGLDAASLGRVTQTARRCAQRAGPNLRYYTSAVAVDDFDLVRRALGYDKINLYGGSYGVTTEQIYLLRHGSHVRSAVLDSGSLLDVHIFEQQPLNKQRDARAALRPLCRRHSLPGRLPEHSPGLRTHHGPSRPRPDRRTRHEAQGRRRRVRSRPRRHDRLHPRQGGPAAPDPSRRDRSGRPRRRGTARETPCRTVSLPTSF